MKEISKITKHILAKKDVEANLALYSSKMMSMYNQFSSIKFAMNYYTVCEVMSEKELDDNYLASVYNRINNAVEKCVINYDPSTGSQLANEISQIRKDIIKHMEVVTSYVDKFQIFEYILNRVEFRFDEDEYNDEYYNSKLTNDVMHYIISDKDSVNVRISEIISQLPIRITKTKFYERISDAFSLYKGNEKSAFDEFVYMIRTVSMLYEPEGFTTDYKDLYEIYKFLFELDYKNITKEQYADAVSKLNYATDKVIVYSDLYVMLEELVNDLLTISLAKPYDIIKEENVTVMTNIISKINDFAMGKEKEMDLDYITEGFMSVEGVQEQLYNNISYNDSVVDDYCGQAILESLMLDKQFAALKIMNTLASNSIFANIEDTFETGEASDEYVKETFEVLTKEFDKLFETVSINIKRAVMSNVIGSLPNFFGNIDELQTYINVSLSQCNDAAEKKACERLIKQIIEDID